MPKLEPPTVTDLPPNRASAIVTFFEHAPLPVARVLFGIVTAIMMRRVPLPEPLDDELRLTLAEKLESGPVP